MKDNNQKGTKVVNSNLILNLNILYIYINNSGFFGFYFLKFETKPKTKQSNLLIQNQSK